MFLTNYYYHQDIIYYPDDFKYLIITTKEHHHQYKYIKFVKSLYPKELKLKGALDAVVVEMKRKGETETLYFIIIRTGKGLYAAHISKSCKLNETLIAHYYKQIGVDYVIKEERMKNDVEKFLITYYGANNVERPKVDNSLRLFNGKRYNLQKYNEFMAFYSLWHKGDAYSYKTVYLRPDYRLYENNKPILVELECTHHEEGDFLWKLLRLHALQFKTYFIFNDLETTQKANFDYHIKLIKRFEKITKRKFQSLYVCRLSELMIMGKKAFVNFNAIRQKTTKK